MILLLPFCFKLSVLGGFILLYVAKLPPRSLPEDAYGIIPHCSAYLGSSFNPLLIMMTNVVLPSAAEGLLHLMLYKQ